MNDDELDEFEREADAAIEREVRNRRAVVEEYASASGISMGKVIPSYEPWRDPGRVLFEFDALAVPVDAVSTNHGRRHAQSSFGESVENFVLRLGRLPSVKGTHSWESYGVLIGWWLEPEGFFLRGLTMLPVEVGQGVSVGEVVHTDPHDEQAPHRCVLLHELSLLLWPEKPDLPGSRVVAVRPRREAAAEPAWLGCLESESSLQLIEAARERDRPRPAPPAPPVKPARRWRRRG